MVNNERIAAIHQYWFGTLNAAGMPVESRNRLWYGGKRDTDTEIEARFGTDVADALAGRLDAWAAAPGGLVALVLLLDQFTRNIYRGTPDAFAGDAMALVLAVEAVTSGADQSLPTIHRVFLYTPFEHAEDLAAQQQGVACFERLLAEAPPGAREQVGEFLRYTRAHRDVIAQFGRFPHRNAILGRDSSTEELAHLTTHGGF